MMKKLYHHNTKNKKGIFFVLGSVFATLFLIFFLSSFASGPILFLSKPVYSLKNSISGNINNLLVVFREKSDLLKENEDLKEKFREKQVLWSMLDLLRRENEEFKEVLSHKDEKTYILSSLISVSSFKNYNALIVDAGLNHGVKNGMQATAFGNVLLGHVEEAASNSSKIRPISFPKQETNVFIGGHVSAVAFGRGGGNMEIVLPNEIEIKIGELITTLDTTPLIMGLVEKIIKDPVDPFQKILFRLPININELRHVYIIKN